MSLASVRLRGYCAADLDAMYALDVACFQPPFRFTRGMMRRFAEAKNARVAIAENNDLITAFGILHVEESIGYVVTLDVAPAWRRQGVANLLMDEMERTAQAAGCTAVVLHVYTGNESAIQFYERRRYALVETDEGFYGPGVDALVYCKSLEPLRT